MRREHFTPRCPEGKHFSPIMQARKGKKKIGAPEWSLFPRSLFSGEKSRPGNPAA